MENQSVSTLRKMDTFHNKKEGQLIKESHLKMTLASMVVKQSGSKTISSSIKFKNNTADVVTTGQKKRGRKTTHR